MSITVPMYTSRDYLKLEDSYSSAVKRFLFLEKKPFH